MTGSYANTVDTDTFLDRNKPSYIGGLLEMCNQRLYGFWGNLTEGLRTGQAQNEVKDGSNPFAVLYADEDRLETFLSAMSGIQQGAFMALAKTFDFSRVRTVCDAGGASGALCLALAREHAHLSLKSFDLPQVAPVARRILTAAGIADRVEVLEGDFFADPLPSADVITMGNILHDWNEEKKLALIGAAYEALPEGGTFIAIESLIDDDRREAAFGLLMSLNMLVETGDGFDYSGAQFDAWCKKVGFQRTEVRPLAGPTFAAIATK